VTPKTDLQVILYQWHANRTSAAAYDTLLDPLEPYFNYTLRSLAWGEPCPIEWVDQGEHPIVFFYVTPPVEALRASGRAVVWAPMWDTARTFPKSFWARLPRNIRILSFSDALSQRTRAAGLITLDVRYYANPDAQPRAPWNGERTAFYWNRTGLVSPHFLTQWCKALKIDRLLFKPQLDPNLPQRLSFTLPGQLGQTRVETVPHVQNRDDYFHLIQSANIFLAPRPSEGIGMTFIEALARGCAVFAYDSPTMNEYIRSGETGVLLRSRTPKSLRALALARRKLAGFGFQQPKPIFYLQDNHSWKEMAALDLPAIGLAAYEAHQQGYARWLTSIPKMAEYICTSQ
jgi:hypothetical protein